MTVSSVDLKCGICGQKVCATMVIPDGWLIVTQSVTCAECRESYEQVRLLSTETVHA